MYRIYSKEKKSKELFNVNLTEAEVKAIMKNNLFLDHPDINQNDCIIVKDTEFSHPTWDGKELREMTREECLENKIDIELFEGEIVENNKIVKLEKPSEHHKWINQKWEINLQELKDNKREEFKKQRDEAVKTILIVEGHPFQVRDSEDRDKFNRIIIGLLTGVIKGTEGRNWRLADNSTEYFSYDFLKTIPAIFSQREGEIFDRYIELDNKLQACTSATEIEKLTWI